MTCSTFRTRSPRASPASSSRRCKPPRCAAPRPGRPPTLPLTTSISAPMRCSVHRRAQMPRLCDFSEQAIAMRSPLRARTLLGERSATIGSPLKAARRSGDDRRERHRSCSPGTRGGGDDPAVLANAAFVLGFFGEDIGAMIGLVDRALALNPNFARGWLCSGILRLWAGDRSRDRACRDVSAPQPARAYRHVAIREWAWPISSTVASMKPCRSYSSRSRTIRALRCLIRFLAACYAHMGRLDEARAIVARLRAITPAGRAERSAFAQPRRPRAFPVGPAPGDGRGDMSQTRRLAAIRRTGFAIWEGRIP